MRAIRAHQWCEPSDLTVEEIDKPVAGPGEVLVKVGAAALNFPDILMIRGSYQTKPQHPFTPGMELAGTIEVAGDGVENWPAGTRVMAQTGLGAFAEYCVVPASAIQAIPDGMMDDEAAGFPLVYQTSYLGLAYRGQLKKGETVLVHSAAGGVGLAALQIARAMGAGKIIGTAGSDEKLALVRANGADVAINYEKEDFVEIVKSVTDGRGADVIYDSVGGDVALKSTKCIAFEGRLIIIGFTSGKFTEFPSNHVLIKNYSIIGLHWGNYRKYNPQMIEQAWEELFSLYRTGMLKPVVAARFSMEEVAEAMALLSSRKAAGKIILSWN